MAIDLWAAQLTRPLTEGERALLLPLLPQERRQRLERLPKEQQREPLCAYLLLLRALEAETGWTRFPRIALGERGKPRFPEHPGVFFSLSHTEGAVMAAVSWESVGVDIQRIRPVRRLAEGREEAEFFREWVRREARTKRSGRGIGAMLREEAPPEPGELCYEVDTFPGYAACAAVGERAGLCRTLLLSQEKLLRGADRFRPPEDPPTL